MGAESPPWGRSHCHAGWAGCELLQTFQRTICHSLPNGILRVLEENTIQCFLYPKWETLGKQDTKPRNHKSKKIMDGLDLKHCKHQQD